MAGAIKRSFSTPDEIRTPPKTRLELVDLGSAKVGRGTLEPGWKWSDCIKPIAGTESCQVRHVGLLVSGVMTVSHDDGTVVDIAAGEAYVIEPGHDAWVVGDESAVAYEFESTAVETFGKATQ